MKKAFLFICICLIGVSGYSQVDFCSLVNNVALDWSNDFATFSKIVDGKRIGTAGFQGSISEYIQFSWVNQTKNDYVAEFYRGTRKEAAKAVYELRDNLKACNFHDFRFKFGGAGEKGGLCWYEFVNENAGPLGVPAFFAICISVMGQPLFQPTEWVATMRLAVK